MPQNQTESGQGEQQNLGRGAGPYFRRFRDFPGGRPRARFWGP